MYNVLRSHCLPYQFHKQLKVWFSLFFLSLSLPRSLLIFAFVKRASDLYNMLFLLAIKFWCVSNNIAKCLMMLYIYISEPTSNNILWRFFSTSILNSSFLHPFQFLCFSLIYHIQSFPVQLVHIYTKVFFQLLLLFFFFFRKLRNFNFSELF